jgi:hypothetical protein
MFYTQCWKCNERWGLGTASTCKCPDETPQRPWVGLTDEEKKSFWTADQMTQAEWDELFNAIEKALKEKNHA